MTPNSTQRAPRDTARVPIPIVFVLFCCFVCLARLESQREARTNTQYCGLFPNAEISLVKRRLGGGGAGGNLGLSV